MNQSLIAQARTQAGIAELDAFADGAPHTPVEFKHGKLYREPASRPANVSEWEEVPQALSFA